MKTYLAQEHQDVQARDSIHFQIHRHTIADGNVLERMYLFGPNGHGTEYYDQDLSKIIKAYRSAGLEYCIPCAGMTEVLTTKITARIGLKYSMGCMRGIGGDPCNNCLKCFRKRGLQ